MRWRLPAGFGVLAAGAAGATADLDRHSPAMIACSLGLAALGFVILALFRSE
jgi:hypothetical protein